VYLASVVLLVMNCQQCQAAALVDAGGAGMWPWPAAGGGDGPRRRRRAPSTPL
jgi:hypothetical protein